MTVVVVVFVTAVVVVVGLKCCESFFSCWIFAKGGCCCCFHYRLLRQRRSCSCCCCCRRRLCPIWLRRFAGLDIEHSQLAICINLDCVCCVTHYIVLFSYSSQKGDLTLALMFVNWLCVSEKDVEVNIDDVIIIYVVGVVHVAVV